MCTSIDIVTEEEVIVTLNITIIVGDAPQIEEPHQVLVLPVDVTKDFDWRVDSQHHWLLLKYAHALFSERQDVLSSEGKVAIAVVLGGPLSWSKQVGQEEVVEAVLWRLLLVCILSTTLLALF